MVRFWTLGTSINDNMVEVRFSLYASALVYHFPFLRARFAVASAYPVTVVADKMTEIVANDENELTKALAKIFNAPTTVETVQRLMSLGQK